MKLINIYTYKLQEQQGVPGISSNRSPVWIPISAFSLQWAFSNPSCVSFWGLEVEGKVFGFVLPFGIVRFCLFSFWMKWNLASLVMMRCVFLAVIVFVLFNFCMVSLKVWRPVMHYEVFEERPIRLLGGMLLYCRFECQNSIYTVWSLSIFFVGNFPRFYLADGQLMQIFSLTLWLTLVLYLRACRSSCWSYSSPAWYTNLGGPLQIYQICLRKTLPRRTILTWS